MGVESRAAMWLNTLWSESQSKMTPFSPILSYQASTFAIQITYGQLAQWAGSDAGLTVGPGAHDG
jgi:hypothetical protein